MTTETVRIGANGLEGYLARPSGANGVIMFAHGSGSSRHSARNTYVAERLQAAGFGTLLFDLLTGEEGQDRRQVFNIGLLGTRVVEAIDWLDRDEALARQPLGIFGASTGAAAALTAAAERPERVHAVVGRGGRPDLASGALGAVRCPSLFVVGGGDSTVIDLNRGAIEQMTCLKRLEIIPGATHLFEEEGALDRVVDLASDWFLTYVRAGNEP
jgi:pimeloyl-ACP methyl ester carboxylesterase